MKKAALLMGMALISAACTVLTAARPTPTATAEPSATPDPCSVENILGEVEKVQELVNEFQDIAYIANFTPKAQLIDPLLKLQGVHSELQNLAVPPCQEALKDAALDYMGAVINYLAFFMGDVPTEQVNAGIQNSQALWQALVAEFNKVFSIAGVEPLELPGLSQAAPAITAAAVLVSNNGSQSVNVRARADINAAIVGTIDPGMTALGIGRTAAGDWLQVNLNGTLGWVSADAVSVNTPVIDIPITTETP